MISLYNLHKQYNHWDEEADRPQELEHVPGLCGPVLDRVGDNIKHDRPRLIAVHSVRSATLARRYAENKGTRIKLDIFDMVTILKRILGWKKITYVQRLRRESLYLGKL